MSSGDVLSAELIGAVDEASEFEVLIAHDARVGRPPGLVFTGEVLDDLGLELRRFIN